MSTVLEFLAHPPIWVAYVSFGAAILGAPVLAWGADR
jgi:hypothetical protein